MKNLLQIYGKYIAVTWGIIFFLIIGNIGIFIYTAGDRIIQGQSVPSGLRKLEPQLFNEAQDPYVLQMQPGAEELLLENEFVFLFVLDDAGNVIFKWQYPDTFPEHYTSGEIAGFTRWYLQDYPVKVWRTDYGLLVAGREKGSVWKQSMEWSEAFMDDLLSYLQVIFWANLVIILFLIGYMGYRFYRSLQPLSEGISMLSRNRKVHLSERGSLSTLAAQLNKTSDILEQQRAFLERRDSARTEWIAGVSHDIRTPLAVIMGYADQLESVEALDTRQREWVEAIKIQSMNIRKLIEDLNLTSKLEYHMQPLRIKEFYPAALLRSLVAQTLNERYGEQYEINLLIDGVISGLKMHGDEELIARAVRNLIHNSIRHNPQGCEICVEGNLLEQEIYTGQSGRSQEKIQITVLDTGKGIPHLVIEALTDVGNYLPYKEQKPHIMGLRIVKQIALAHGGDFGITDNGHRVALTFPVQSECGPDTTSD